MLTEADRPVYKNVAIVKGSEKEKETPPVEVEVGEPGFSIHKEQRVAGEPAYTAAKLVSEAGKKVEYKITVTNTGNTTLKFGALKDAKCTGVLPAGETMLKAGEAETFSCEHTLTEADKPVYTNTASIEGGKETKTSNTVEVEINPPNFEVIKEQRIKGEASFTKAKLKAEVGETVEYKITVKNTGLTTVKFEALKDANCTNFVPALGAFELAPGGEKGYTCEHVLTEADRPVYKNVAIVKGSEKEKETPPVEVEVGEPGFSIHKEQRVAGEPAYTAAKLVSEAGKKVEYKITVTNTGNTTLKFGALKDAKCTGVLPAGETMLKAGEAETFSCEHTLTEADKPVYTNTASIEGGKETKTSNTVEVEINPPNFEVIKEQRIKGEASFTKAKLKAEVGETVEYKITVKNTGLTTVKFEALKDANCTNFVPALGAFELAPGGEKGYTCEHVLTEADRPVYKNVAIVKGSEKEKETPPVEVEVGEPGFSIHKEQRVAGEPAYTAAKLVSEAGKKVEYKITVTNTGNTTLKFGALKDAKCTGVLPAGETMLKAGEAETFSCEHTLTEADKPVYTNTASIEGGKETKTSNTVEVEINPPNFEVIKEQRIKGEASFTKAKLKAEVGETVEYKITVKNTGLTTVKFEALKDANCTNFVPALGAFELAPGGEKGYTCEHVLTEADRPVYKNVAIVKGSEKEKETPPVEVEVGEPGFSIHKEQRVAGEPAYTAAKLVSEAGKKVEYKITVTNTGNTTLKFGALKDAKCTGVLPAGETMLKAGEAETFSCEHTLTEADKPVYTNTASIEGGKETKTSNTVEVEINPPNFEVIKEQRIKGEASFTKAKLKAEVGETVEYKITVKNTGLTTVKFEALKDANCTNFVPALGAFELAPGGEKGYTCEHVLTEADRPVYKNVAIVKGSEKEKETPPVEVEVGEPGFSIHKEQRIAGEPAYTAAKLVSEAGKKVEYKITVTNTGNTTLKFGALKDAKCTGVLPAGETMLKAGEAETFSCEHTLTEADKPVYTNTASIEGGKETKTSNTVEVEINPPNFEVIKEQRIKGEASFTKAKLKAEVGRDRGIQDHGQEHGSDDREIRSAQRREMHELRAGAGRVRTRAGGETGLHVRTRAH